MSEVKLSCCKVETGKADKLRSWYQELEKRAEEVEKSLENEDMFTETAFIQENGQDTYLFVYMESDDMEKAEKAGDKEKFDIDQDHHEVLEECLTGDWSTLETIGHMVNPER